MTGSAKSAWGDKDTQYFHALTPDRVLDAVEKSTGLRCTGRAMALNSMENRVYELEIELDEAPRTPSERFVIAKFYRPGRWSEQQILEEHEFLHDLIDTEIPAVPPRRYLDGRTLHKLKDAGIYYAVFPKIGGRSPDELDDDQLARAGRLLARLHSVGAARQAPHRIALDPQTYGLDNLKFLTDLKLLPDSLAASYQQTVEALVALVSPWFAEIPAQRIHGDCHLGNLLMGRDGLFFVDFDDMVRGPAVQDIWLLIPGRDAYAQSKLRVLLAAYETMRPFDRRQLRLIEPLRALRFVHFSAWIGRRWQDPAFPKAFPQYGTEGYWREQLADLREQLALAQDGFEPFQLVSADDY
jgi:Ser/Thr protein kinase RdoA (MazF antagonist)